MLTRCVASGKCCPKLPEEDFGRPGENAHLYCNPYMLEELSAPEHGDFGPGALSLMYAPPMEPEGDDFSDGDVDEWMQDPQACEQNFANVAQLMRMPPSTARTRAASPGAALLASSPRGPFAALQKRAATLQMVHDQAVNVEGLAGAPMSPPSPSTGSTRPRPFEGTLRNRSEPPLNRNADLPSAASRVARSQTPSATTPRRCNGDNGDVQPSIGPGYYPSESDNPWLAAQMNFRGRKMFGDENVCNSDIGAASISTIKKCIAKAQCLPEQQRPNSEKWTERWNGIQVKQKDLR